ncbi:MFS transporter [bacterium]|nr:MFS transporter [bacterium]
MKRSPLVLILVTVFIALVGFGIVIPLLPIYGARYGAGGFVVGLLLMSYSLMQFLLAPVFGRLSDRIGRRPVILGALIITTASYVMLAFADNLWMLFASRILAGIGGADITVAQAYIADVTPRDKRAKGMGLFGAAFGFGFMLGPMLGGTLSAVNDALPSLAAAGFTTVTLIFAFFMLPEPEKHSSAVDVTARKRLSLIGSVTGAPLIVALFHFGAVTIQGQLQSMLVLFTNVRFGWTEVENGWYLGMIGFIAISVQGGLIGPLAKRFGQRRLVHTGLFLVGIGMTVIGTAHSLTHMLVGGVINAIGFSLILPSLSSLASLAADPERQGQTLGVFQSFGSMGRILAPMMGGLLFDQFNPETPLLTGAVFAILAALISIPAFRIVSER